MKVPKVTFFILVVGISMFFVGVMSSAIYEMVTPRVGNVGRVRVIGVEVYRDAELTETMDFIDWGIVGVGQNKTVPAWIRNTGNDAQRMVMWTSSWNPSNASDWISLSWDYDGSWIPANGTIPVSFTLSVDPEISGIVDFSFDIWIKGE